MGVLSGAGMRIIVTGPEYYGYSDSICYAIESLGHRVLYYPMQQFYTSCSYWQRKLYKLGLSCLATRFESNWQKGFAEAVRQFAGEDVLVLVLSGDIHPAVIAEKNVRAVLWTWDTIRDRAAEWYNGLKYYERIFLFEENDLPWLKECYKLDAAYLPLGYDSRIYKPVDCRKDLDISFVGSITGERLSILEKLADMANERRWRLYVGGPWYDVKNILRRRRFMSKHAMLSQYIDNRRLSPAEVAAIYNRSKICLNLNQDKHNSISPRTTCY